MVDSATVVEFKMDILELNKTVEQWATEMKFAIHEKSEKRILYSKNIRLNTAWLSIEGEGENSKIVTWIAPKGMKPDAKGSTWSGWKIEIPHGFSFGPPAIYRKQFNKLMETLKSKSNSSVMIQTKNKNQPKINKVTFATGLAVIGALELLTGVLSIISASALISSYPDLGNISLKNGTYSVILGTLTFISSRMLKNGKVLAIWLYGAAILLNVTYEVVMGHKLPYFAIFFGALIIWQLVKSKEEWELS